MHIALMVQFKNKHAVCLEASTDLGEQFCCTRALQMNMGRFYGNHTLRAKLIDLTRAFTVTKRRDMLLYVVIHKVTLWDLKGKLF